MGGNNLTFDNNGNTKVDENGRQYIYDAWDRVVEMKTSGAVRIARFSFDALGRRITETDNGPAKDFYYSAQWQLLEERHTGAVKAQHIWSPVYVDALIVRDRNNDANPDLEERLYVQQDANWNVTAVVNPGGQLKERYVYDPFGQPTAIKADWTSYTSGQEAGLYDWLYLHQGGRFFRFDSSAGVYHFRNRELSATLGRWMQVDPIGFKGRDANLYRAVGNNPVGRLDSHGLQEPVSTAAAGAATATGTGVAAGGLVAAGAVGLGFVAYLGYQLIDATIDYFAAVEAGEKLISCDVSRHRSHHHHHSPHRRHLGVMVACGGR